MIPSQGKESVKHIQYSINYVVEEKEPGVNPQKSNEKQKAKADKLKMKNFKKILEQKKRY